MDIVNNFKAYLFTDKSKPSKVTVKNYLSDVRRFLEWYEQTYQTPFNPLLLSSTTIEAFQSSFKSSTEGSVVATSSAKRYISSLRKFCRFLRDSGAIESNPFDLLTTTPRIPEDPWQMKSFRNSLIAQKASKLTIKNYLLDIQQFLSWLEKVTEGDELSQEQRFLKIDLLALNQYKERLLSEARFSPISINRKLSSLRRYMGWLIQQGLIEKKGEVSRSSATPTPIITQIEAIEETPIPLTALLEIPKDDAEEKITSYSRFAPLRLFQKTHKAISKGADFLIFNPIVESAEAIQYALWKNSGKSVFAPVKTFLNETVEKLPANDQGSISIKAASTINRMTTKTASIVSSFVHIASDAKPYRVRNISKSFYAPLSISLTHLSWQQKLIHHLRYTRPAWYHKYHAWPIAHHIHFAILIFAMAVAGVASYQTATGQPSSNTAAVASQPMAPPRTLSFQGRLLDKTNTPITAETNLRFAVYNSPSASGAAQLWQEVQEVKPNHDGYFSTVLGKKASLSQQLFNNNANLYVGIAVGINEELQPRQQIATTSYASNTQALQGLKPITGTDATENVVLALDSSGDLTIGGSASPTFQATGGQFSLSGQSLLLTTNPGSNGNIELTPDGSGIIDMQAPLQNTTNTRGVTGVLGAVEVADLFSVIATSSGQAALTVKQNSTGDIISGFNNEIAKFRVDALGSGMFAGDLQINGNTIATNTTTFGIANTNVVNLTIGASATSLSLGASSGNTTINNNLNIQGTTTLNGPASAKGLITANEGITIASGKNLTLSDFTPGAIPFIGASNQIAQDAGSFAWDTIGKSFKVVGAVCVKANAGTCAGSTAGTIYAANATVQAADLAENYISSQQLEPGDIVIPESLGNSLAIIKSTAAYQPQVIGIVSTKPGFTLNSDAQGDATHPHVFPLALQGRVPVKVSSMNGPIKAGDPLTSSSFPGIAMKATKPGQIIAKALEDYNNTDPNAVGKVMAFVNISYQVPQSALTENGDLNLAVNSGIPSTSEEAKKGIIASIKSNLIEAKEISTESFRVTTDSFFVNGQHLRDYISGIVIEVTGKNIASTDETTDIINSITLAASDSATTTILDPKATTAASKAIVASTSGQKLDTQIAVASNASEIDSLYNGIATPSAAPTIPPISQTASAEAELKGEIDALVSGDAPDFMEELQKPTDLGLETLDTKNATVAETLSVLGRTTLSDVGITGKMTVGLISIDGLNTGGFASFNTSSGPLKIQSHGFGGVDFMNGKVAITPNGNLEVNGNATFAKDVTIKGKLAANIIAPIPGSDLTVQNSNGTNVVKVNQKGDVVASGSGKFANINIVRGAQADTSSIITNANGSAGKGIIKAKQKERTIYSPYVTKESLIYVTATSDTQKMTPYVARQTAQVEGKGSFTIQISNTVSKDITFNWWIVN